MHSGLRWTGFAFESPWPGPLFERPHRRSLEPFLTGGPFYARSSALVKKEKERCVPRAGTGSNTFPASREQCSRRLNASPSMGAEDARFLPALGGEALLDLAT